MSQLSSDFDNDKALKARRGDFRCIIIMCVCGGGTCCNITFSNDHVPYQLRDRQMSNIAPFRRLIHCYVITKWPVKVLFHMYQQMNSKI